MIINAMKFTLDFSTKTVTVNGTFPINELVDKLNEILGDDFKNWKIEGTVYSYVPYYNPTIYPTYQDLYKVTCSTN